MKKFLLIAAVMTGFAGAGCAQNKNIPEPVKQAFAKKFPGTTAKWEKENEQYEAGFTVQGTKMSALFEKDGTLLESETEIKKTDLPSAITVYLNTHYKGAAIKEAAKITLANGDIQYEAEVKGKDLIFDAAGKFLKEVKN